MNSMERGPLLRKIEAFLADSRLPWAYADKIAAKICKVERVSWCTPDQMFEVTKALARQARRRGKRV
jgi:hypothetical protein